VTLCGSRIRLKQGHEGELSSGIIAVLTKRGNSDIEDTQKENGVKRHRKKVAIYKPRREA